MHLVPGCSGFARPPAQNSIDELDIGGLYPLQRTIELTGASQSRFQCIGVRLRISCIINAIAGVGKQPSDHLLSSACLFYKDMDAACKHSFCVASSRTASRVARMRELVNKNSTLAHCLDPSFAAHRRVLANASNSRRLMQSVREPRRCRSDDVSRSLQTELRLASSC